ncbi:MAG: Lrp/AsnC family transcriptional regulator [Bacteroidetes bacterium]|nr:Lrp/AsnC family transcriptional regulator [Bacteroidota bacterium]
MSATAYVLINVKMGKAKSVFRALQNLDNVYQVDALMGPYDMIVILQDSDFASIGATIMDIIQMIDGVTKTVTCNVVSMGN